MQECHENPHTLLKKSADVQYYRGHILTMGVMIVCFTLLAALCAIAVGDPVFWLVALPGLLIGVPIIAWDAFNLCHIFKNAEKYRFFHTVLAHSQSTWGRRLYFIVHIEGQALETRAVFNSYGLFGPQFNDYSNKAALVGYNEATEEVVVIERKELY